MTPQPTRPQGKRWGRFVAVCLLLLVLLGGEAGRRAWTGHGRLHRLAAAISHRLKARRVETEEDAPASATVAVTVDTNADRHPISPYIYGMAFAPADYLTDLRLTVNRWGGNDKSRYNWVEGNACNAARDWRWANRSAWDGAKKHAPSSAADAFYLQNHAAGAATLLTVPTLGWVARDADNSHTSRNVPATGGAPLAASSGSSNLSASEGAISGYDPAENRRLTSVRSAATSPVSRSDPLKAHDPVVYQDAWVHHLVQSFGPAAQSGVRFYALDNEPDLWDITHTDVHPARMGYDAMLANFLEYATAIKAADPSAEVTGPVASGWTALLYSSLDRGEDNFHTHADCTAHGGEAFIFWFLKQVQVHDIRKHTRTLDVLDVHYYPQGQGLYGPDVQPETRARRLRETRSLWDAAYTDESWIGEPVRLIPRLKEWIAAGYPGTKIGITEWNFGADQDMNGALAIAEVLGIYGREDVYLADYWAYPPKNSPGYLAFRLYRNADGHGHGFGDQGCRAVTTNTGRLSCFAATDTQTGDLTLLLINKMERTMLTAPLTISGHNAVGPAKIWTLSAANPKAILAQADRQLHNSSMTLSIAPSTILLLRIPTR